MQFSVAPEIFASFPGLRLAVAVSRGLDNTSDRPDVEALWRAAWADAAAASIYGNAQSHPRVRPWREHFQALGVSGKQFPSSVEALLRRALKGGQPFAINPLVDWYNALSLRHVVPAGGFDLDALETLGGPLELRLTRAGDSFTALDTQAPEQVPPDEIAYAAGQTVLTRHFVWRQARAGLITRETRGVFLVSEILGEVGAEVADAMRADFAAGLSDHFGVTPATWLIDAAHLQIAW